MLRNFLKCFVIISALTATATAVAAQSLLDVVKKRGYVSIGVRKDFPPAGYIDEKGEWVGSELDFAKYIAKKLGVELRMVEVVSKTKIAMVLSENVDISMGASNPSRERSQVVDFTQPYHVDGRTILIRKDTNIKGLADLADRKVGTTQGSLDGLSLKARQPKAELVSFQEYPQAINALQQGRIDAVTTSLSVLGLYAKQDPKLAIILPTFKPDPWVLIVRQNDSKWRLALEEIIMDANADGTLAAIQEKFFGGRSNLVFNLWIDYFPKE